MKHRQGFVSNSSSSSFCILGVDSSIVTTDRDTVLAFPSNYSYWDNGEEVVGISLADQNIVDVIATAIQMAKDLNVTLEHVRICNV